MRRAPLVLSTTVAGVAATLGFHAHAATAPAATAPTAVTAVTATSTSKASAASGAASATTSSAPAKTTTSTTVTSDAVSNQYGQVQLKVTVKDGKITDVQAVQLPTGDPRSAQINAYAAPILRQSTLTAQSADIDSVSGATYTSESYKTALQSVLDKVTLSSGATTS